MAEHGLDAGRESDDDAWAVAGGVGVEIEGNNVEGGDGAVADSEEGEGWEEDVLVGSAK